MVSRFLWLFPCSWSVLCVCFMWSLANLTRKNSITFILEPIPIAQWKKPCVCVGSLVINLLRMRQVWPHLKYPESEVPGKFLPKVSSVCLAKWCTVLLVLRTYYMHTHIHVYTYVYVQYTLRIRRNFFLNKIHYKLNSAKVSNRRLTWRRRRTFVFISSSNTHKYKKVVKYQPQINII